MKPPQFSYAKVTAVEDAVEALGSNVGELDDPIKVLAGGQSLVPLMNFRLARPAALVDINGIEELHTIHEDGDGIKVGATYRHRDIETWAPASSGWQACHDAVKEIGHVAIRNRGTVVGSITHADPLAEWPALAVLFDGEVHVEGINGRRVVNADDFFQGVFMTALEAEEIVTHVSFHRASTGSPGSAFAEVSRRRGDFCLVAAAARVVLDERGRITESRIVVSGLGDRPWRIREAEELLRSNVPSTELFSACGELIATTNRGRSDLHASAEYRRRVGASLIADTLTTACRRAQLAGEGTTRPGIGEPR